MRELLLKAVLDRVLAPSRPDEEFFTAGPAPRTAPLRPAPVQQQTAGPATSLASRPTH